MFEIRRLDKNDAGGFTSMTFPVYRHLLSLEEGFRHPEQGDRQRVIPLAVGAFVDGEPAGLALGELTSGVACAGELLSLMTRVDVRNQGIASALVHELETCLRERGAESLKAVYMTGKPSIVFVERIFARLDWSTPTVRTLTVRFTPDEARQTSWFDRLRLGKEFEVFPWTELGSDEQQALIESQKSKPWISPGLEAWRHTPHGFDEVTSIGVRYQGEVVGWVINHSISPGRVRFTCSYIRKDLGRRGRILPLFTESIRRLADSGGTMGSFITPVAYETMIRFIRRRCEPWASFVGETRGAEKPLSQPKPADG